MAKATEIRIGNWITTPLGKLQQVDASMIAACNKYPNHIWCYAIDITSAIAQKCGLAAWNPDAVKEDANGIKYYEYNFNGLTIKSDRVVKYLHQLQNLYFDSTREELHIENLESSFKFQN